MEQIGTRDKRQMRSWLKTTYLLTIKVLNSNKEPVQFAYVDLKANYRPEHYSGYTDAQGCIIFRLEKKTSNYHLSVSKLWQYNGFFQNYFVDEENNQIEVVLDFHEKVSKPMDSELVNRIGASCSN